MDFSLGRRHSVARKVVRRCTPCIVLRSPAILASRPVSDPAVSRWRWYTARVALSRLNAEPTATELPWSSHRRWLRTLTRIGHPHPRGVYNLGNVTARRYVDASFRDAQPLSERPDCVEEAVVNVVRRSASQTHDTECRATLAEIRSRRDRTTIAGSRAWRGFRTGDLPSPRRHRAQSLRRRRPRADRCAGPCRDG